jgi:UDP-N-acetylmuramyl-tripeptide synthetase
LSHTLRDLLAGATIGAVRGSLDRPVAGVTIDSRAVAPGDVFFALAGQKQDGYRFAADAVARGAAAVVGERPPPAGDDGATWVQVADARRLLAPAAARAYDDPSAELTLVGVTGTNGKTTICWLLESLFRAAGRSSGVLGTVSVRYAGRDVPAALTTPEAPELQRTLRAMRDAGVSHVAMEVSSHAIDLGRTAACRFAVGVFTNLTRDHLDWHGDLEAYGSVKERWLVQHLAEGGGARGAAVNLDDPWGRRIAAKLRVPLVGYSARGAVDAAVRATALSVTLDGLALTVETPRGPLALRSPLVGQHNAENVLAAVASAELLGLPHAAVQAGIADLRVVPGRLERVDNDLGFAIAVDYAHTDDALDNVTRALKPLTAGRLITIFGCGGDRDRTKRPLMGGVAVRNSDLVVVTSDNPRTEDPHAIVADILPGVDAAGGARLAPADLPDAARGVVVEVDRRRAIHLAVAAARPGDAVLIAGKGHEDYQVVGTTKHHFDDREVARDALAARAAAGVEP